MMISWKPSPVCAAGSIPLTACLSVQLVLQARIARNLEENDTMMPGSRHVQGLHLLSIDSCEVLVVGMFLWCPV